MRLPFKLAVVVALCLLPTVSSYSVGEGPWECLWGTGCTGGGGSSGLQDLTELTECLEANAADVICILDPTVTWEMDEYDWDPADLAGPQSAVIDCNGATINRANGALAHMVPTPDTGGEPTNNDDTVDTFWLTVKDCIFTASDQPAGGNIDSFADGTGSVIVNTAAAEPDYPLADDSWVRIWNNPHGATSGITYAEMWYGDTSGLGAKQFRIPATWNAEKGGATAAEWREVRAIIATSRLAPSNGRWRANTNGIKMLNNVYDWQGSLEGSAVVAFNETTGGVDYSKNMNLVFNNNSGNISTRADSGGIHDHSVGGLKSYGDKIRAFDEIELCEYWAGHDTVFKEYPPQDLFMYGDEWFECGGWFWTTRFHLDINTEATSIGQFYNRAPVKIAAGLTAKLVMRAGGEQNVLDDLWYKNVDIIHWIHSNQTDFPSKVDIEWKGADNCADIGNGVANPFLEIEDTDTAKPEPVPIKGGEWNISIRTYGLGGSGCTRPNPYGPLLLADFVAIAAFNGSQGLFSQTRTYIPGAGWSNVERRWLSQGVLYDKPPWSVRYGTEPPAVCHPGELWVDTTPGGAVCSTKYAGQLCTCLNTFPPTWVAVDTEPELETQIGVTEIYTTTTNDFTEAQLETSLQTVTDVYTDVANDFSSAALANSLTDNTGSGAAVFGTTPIIAFPSGSGAPGTCATGEIFVCTSGGGTCCTASADICVCTSPNTWTLNNN